MADPASKRIRNGSKGTALRFIECINSGDCKGLMDLQTEDFTFIDFSGDVHIGKDSWENYFTSYPDYKIHVDKLITSGSGVAVIGRTTGSHAGPEVDESWTILISTISKDSSFRKKNLTIDTKNGLMLQ